MNTNNNEPSFSGTPAWWHRHWQAADADTAHRFNTLQPEDMQAHLEAALDLRCIDDAENYDSLENRVFAYTVENADGQRQKVVLKCHRPGRWTTEALREEQQLVSRLAAAGISVIAPLCNESGESLFNADGLHFAVYPAIEGEELVENMDALQPSTLRTLGTMAAAIHTVARGLDWKHRPILTPEGFGCGNREYLLQHAPIPPELQSGLADTSEELIELCRPHFQECSFLPVHGDLHFGNVLQQAGALYVFDFDDGLLAPAAQDAVIVYRLKAKSPHLWRAFMEGYAEEYPQHNINQGLLEALRALRRIWFRAWIAARWHDALMRNYQDTFDQPEFWECELKWYCSQCEILRGMAA